MFAPEVLVTCLAKAWGKWIDRGYLGHRKDSVPSICHSKCIPEVKNLDAIGIALIIYYTVDLIVICPAGIIVQYFENIVI